MCYTSCVMLLFYTLREVYTKFGTVSGTLAIFHHYLKYFSKPLDNFVKALLHFLPKLVYNSGAFLSSSQ